MAFLPGYALTTMLGSGAQATVYKGTANNIGDDGVGAPDQVAVKIFDPKFAQASFQSELRLLTAVQQHRNVVRLVASFEACCGLDAIVLEFCGRDMHKLVSKRVFSEKKSVKVMRDVLTALDHVHSLQIVHRDVKPENIAFGEDGRARLMDFGIAAFVTDGEELSRCCGSLGYVAPEVLAKKTYSFPVDLFGLGATFFFTLSGKHAFGTPNMTQASVIARTKKAIVSFSADFDHVSLATKNLIMWLTYKTASWRPSARGALSEPPFAEKVPSQDADRQAYIVAPPVGNIQHGDDEVNAVAAGPHSLAARLAEPRPPSEPRVRRARPAPKARTRPVPEA
eukprot:TRINITY_DN6033_c0_g1_i4.p1 TRINITY_DN6033_c0_g1~~TRINITY_DN6033_c0_g1_i4.p1  ORF type:complete len:354 (+),score=56.98 TRINITY_DN6033_c0_g1_i4:49-1062(+)